jgi:hypothetical protein
LKVKSGFLEKVCDRLRHSAAVVLSENFSGHPHVCHHPWISEEIAKNSETIPNQEYH